MKTVLALTVVVLASLVANSASAGGHPSVRWYKTHAPHRSTPVGVVVLNPQPMSHQGVVFVPGHPAGVVLLHSQALPSKAVFLKRW